MRLFLLLPRAIGALKLVGADRRSVCVDDGQDLLRAYHETHWHGDEELGWPPLLLSGINRCVDAQQEPCTKDAMEWIELNAAAMYHNMVRPARRALADGLSRAILRP